jgi:serine phosphatase RsbU (regulator of sigma subunit)/anti-sigma regulatory factor (Ser/Thr protein kinase)/CHASE3 domain sensor protein
MNRRLALLTGGYFVAIGVVFVAVLPFAISVLRVDNVIRDRLAPAQARAREVLFAALDQETSAGAYVITPAPEFAQSYQDGQRAAADAARRLRSLSLQTDERAAANDMINALRTWQREYADAEIALVASGDTTEARSPGAITRGKMLFETFRSAHERFVALVDARLQAQRDELHRDSLLAIAALIVASVVAALTAVMLGRWARRSLQRDEQRTRERIAFGEVHRLGAVLANASTTDDVARIAALEAARLLDADDVHVWAIGDRDRLHLAGSTDTLAQQGRAPSVLAASDRNAPADAIRRNSMLVFADRHAFANAYPGWVAAFDGQGAYTLAVVPTRSDQTPAGVLEIFYREPHTFDDGERTLLELTADQIGNALSRSRARELEHAAAARLQESLLGPLMLVDGVGHTTRYLGSESTLHVGGDWHNAQRLPDGRIMVAVGDVVGRGLEAATVMGQLRSAVSACALRCATPAQLIGCLDDFAADIPGAPSTTVGIAYVDIERQTLDYASAGHPPPLLVSPTGHVVVLEDAVSWPLAVCGTARTDIGTTVPFPAGSMVLLYTDGLVERRSEPIDYGIARLVTAVRAHWNLPVDTLCDRIISSALAGRRRNDDVALLALRSPVSAPDLFLMKLEAAPVAVGRVRERLRGWLDNLALDPDDQLAILVAVGEACTNTIEHAYGDGNAHLFRVEACIENGEVVCCVTDTGAWKDNAARTARGNGLNIMRELMDEVHVERRATGTSVTLKYRPRARNESTVPSSPA